MATLPVTSPLAWVALGHLQASPPCPCPVLCINVGRPEPALCHPSAVAGSLCEAGTSRGPGPDSAQLP